MPRLESLLSMYQGRIESPEIELILQEEIGIALAELLGSKGLYQSCEIDLTRAKTFLKSISSNKQDDVIAEFSCRPWAPSSPKVNSENQTIGSYITATGSQPLGTPAKEMYLPFPMPAFKSFCKKCKCITTHNSIGSIWRDKTIDKFPNLDDNSIELFNFHYNCDLCSDFITAFLVKRVGYRVQLCGRSERLYIQVPEAVPKKLRQIISDAISSVAENDIHAGYYHLRTFCEHYIKIELSISIRERINGEELCSVYNSKVDSKITSILPSLSSIYTETSKCMHERSGTYQEFYTLLDQIYDHLQGKALFFKYNTTQSEP